MTKNSSLLTLMMTSAQVVETSIVAVGNLIQDNHTHPDDNFPRLESNCLQTGASSCDFWNVNAQIGAPDLQIIALF